MAEVDPVNPAATTRAPAPGLSPEHEDAVRTQIVRDLYDRSRLAIVTMLVLLGVIRWAIDPAYRVDADVRLAFAALIAINLARFALAMVPQATREARLGRRGQLGLFIAGIGLSSIALATIVVLSWPILDPARIAIVAVITSGLVSGAVMSLGFSPLVYMIYMLPPVGALFVMAVTDTRPPWGADILASAFAIYALAVVAISLDQRRNRRNAIALALQLSDLVVRDSLTKLHNRRFLQELMAVESARIARDARDLEQGREPRRAVATGLFMMDLDHFKQVNDTHGHAGGDAILRQTGDALCGALRKSDHLVRWGGEEFVAIARVTEAGHVRLVGEKLRAAVASARFTLPDGTVLNKTVSVGFAAMPFFPDLPRRLTWEQVLSLADAALYVAKAEGRNRWVGVLPGAAPWDDVDATCAEVLQDLRVAEQKGLVRLDRGGPTNAA
jgi:diguanylate cyclase (GGDEF)-like protein